MSLLSTILRTKWKSCWRIFFFFLLFFFLFFFYLVDVRSKLDKDNANISGLFWVNPHRTSQIEKLTENFPSPQSNLFSLPFLSFSLSLSVSHYLLHFGKLCLLLHIICIHILFLLGLFFFINEFLCNMCVCKRANVFAPKVLGFPWQMSNNTCTLYTINPLIIL